MSGDDFDRTITSVERIIGYCERISPTEIVSVKKRYFSTIRRTRMHVSCFLARLAKKQKRYLSG